jgi:hypothetical protein
MAAPGSHGEGQTTRIIKRLAKDRGFLGSTNIRGPTVGTFRNARHPRGSTRAGFARPTESLAGAGICWGACPDRHRNG